MADSWNAWGLAWGQAWGNAWQALPLDTSVAAGSGFGGGLSSARDERAISDIAADLRAMLYPPVLEDTPDEIIEAAAEAAAAEIAAGNAVRAVLDDLVEEIVSAYARKALDDEDDITVILMTIH